MSQPVVTVEDVHKSFGDERVLEGVNLGVREGELLVLMGPNGVGKSVLLSCLTNGRHPSRGRIELFGTPPAECRDRTSFLLQDALVLDKLTGRQNVAFYRRLHPQFTDAWKGLVDEFDLADHLDKTVEAYSGGMRRKLELVIALSIDVPLYVLDEPTAALDLSMVNVVHNRLLERRAAGKTLLVSSHLPMDADVADRIAFLSEAGIVTTGPPRDILDAVPPVVETTVTNADAIREFVIDGRLFDIKGGVHGILSPDASPGAVRDACGGDVDVVDPGYGDMFNYYAYLYEPD